MKKITAEHRKQWFKQEIALNIFRVSSVEIVMLTKHLSVMLSAGLTLTEAIQGLQEQATGMLKRVLIRVHRRITQGQSFAESIEKEPRVFNSIFVSSVYVGESSGMLAENLSRLSIQMEKSMKIRRDIQSAMMYPLIVVIMTIILGLGVAVYILPQIASVFRSLRVDLPWTTRVLMKIAGLFENHGFILSVGILTFCGLFVWFIRLKFTKPFIDRFVLSIPGFGAFIHDINRAQIARILGTLLVSGTPISETLEIASEATPNYVYKMSVQSMHKRIVSGDNFADVVGAYPTLYPGIIKQMIAVGEKSGSLGESLNYLADFYEERVENTSKNISSLVEPVLLIGIGGLVALLAISILTPIYSILGSVRG